MDSILALEAVTSADAGIYDVVVSDGCGTTTSATARMVVETMPAITRELSDQSVCEGASLSLVVEASGASLNYQWRKGGLQLPDQTGPQLLIAPVELADSGSYDVMVTNSCGEVLSSPASVIVWRRGGGDINGDGYVDGLDISSFVDVILLRAPTDPPDGSSCAADIDLNRAVDPADVGAFTEVLIGPRWPRESRLTNRTHDVPLPQHRSRE